MPRRKTQPKNEDQEKRLICECHDEIKELGKELENLDLQRIIDIAKRLQDVAVEAKAYGQSMENRLSDYRSAVEGLGFSRDK